MPVNLRLAGGCYPRRRADLWAVRAGARASGPDLPAGVRRRWHGGSGEIGLRTANLLARLARTLAHDVVKSRPIGCVLSLLLTAVTGRGVVSAGHDDGAAEAVWVFGRDDLGAVAVVADGDPRGAGVEAFNFPLAAEVGHDRGELAGVIPMLQEFPQGGHSLSNEDDRRRGRGPPLRRVAVGGLADLPQAAKLAKQGGQAGSGVAGRAGCGVRHCRSPGLAGSGRRGAHRAWPRRPSRLRGRRLRPQSAARALTMSRPCGRPSRWAWFSQGPPLSSTSMHR